MGTRTPLLAGHVFSRLTVVGPAQPRRRGRETIYRVSAECSCGTLKDFDEAQLRKGHAKSCGCWPRERMAGQKFTTTHGLSKSDTYDSWASMVNRCTNAKCKSFPDYGGRGIKVCDSWLTFASFLADMGEKPHKYTIERIDNERGYEPGNCVWVAKETQAKNKRSNRHVTVRGETMILADAARLLGVKRFAFYNRMVRDGVSLQQAVDLVAFEEAA